MQQLFIDPSFDLLRLPDKREVPSALNTLFNRQAKTFVLSANASENMQEAWRALARIFSYRQNNMPLQSDNAGIPESEVVVLLGADTSLLTSLLPATEQQPFALTDTHYTLDDRNYSRSQHSLALSLQSDKQQIILLDAANPEGLRALAQKLPHYGKYSYVLFNNASAQNVAKGQWQVQNSPMAIQLNSP